MAKKEAKSIFGDKRLQKINTETPPPDKRDYLEEFLGNDAKEKESSIPSVQEASTPTQKQPADEDSKVYKSYYALGSSHETFRDIVYSLRQKVDADLNNGEVFDRMLAYYKQYVEETHGVLLKAKPPKRGRR